MTERLIGFDCREMGLNFKTTWLASRIKQYLLKNDIEKPLSTDVMVWPSMFTSSDSKWVGHQDLWDSMDEMEEELPTIPRSSFG